MRPIFRGPAPHIYAKYQDAIGDLEDRLGRYCSYCERYLPVSLAVEHVAPKSREPALCRIWDNFLLGCTNCNSVKQDQPTNHADFLWPDHDNTLKAFDYENRGLVQVGSDLPPDVRIKAQRLMDLVGLDRHPGQPRSKKPRKRDKRYQQREEVWQLAERHRQTLKHENTTVVRELITDLAVAYGFFSVWMTVYADDIDMRIRLVAAFRGTATDCFDATRQVIPRPGGRL